uniref:Uncharacterized protein n=1 Tax=Cyanothece sp. (strain PCC 7425 / ATCC 29141) TaxID=395961 RepID=B8HPP4_CYAP4
MKDKQSSSEDVIQTKPQIYEASLESGGAVVRGSEITQEQAVARRRSGLDVVVCGPSLAENSKYAKMIEQTANSAFVRHPPHANAGAYALPHYQADPGPPDGHTFYETDKRKAFS